MPTPTRRFYVNGAPTLTTSTSITNSATSVTTAAGWGGYPTQFPFFVCLDRNTASQEIVSVTNLVGATATIVRAQDGTTAVSHPGGATIDFVVIAKDYDEANAHTSATAGVHGITGSVVGTTDAQTLTNKTLSTGTVANSPTVNTPTITGGSISTATHFGDATHSALVGRATTSGGRTLSLQDSSGTEHTIADDAGLLRSTTLQATTSAVLPTNTTANGAYVVTTPAGVATTIQANSLAVNTLSGSTATATLSATFPNSFSATPIVVPGVQAGSTSDRLGVKIVSISSSGFQFVVFTTNGATAAGNATLYWIAIGNT